MQDKDNIANIDEQFTDLGWEKMRGVLNEEMPVAPVRKRRWAWLWLLLFLGIMAGGTYYNFSIKNNTIKPNEIPNTADVEIVDVIENTSDPTTFEENDEATENSKGKEIEKLTNTSKTPVITDIQPKEKIIISPKNTVRKEAEKNIVQNNLYIEKENNFIDKNNTKQDLFSVENKVENSSIEKITNTVEVPVISKKEPIESTASPVAVLTENKARSPFVSTERIATLSTQMLRPKDLKNNELSTFDPIPKPRKFSQTYSAFAGVRSDEFSGFSGVNAGLLAHYRFTPKVGVETGLMYANTRKDIDTNKDYTAEVTAQYPDNTQQFNRIVTDALSLHYLRLPLAFTYRPHAKIQLFTGLNAGYRFAINGASGAYAEYDITNTTSPNAPDTGSQITDDTYESTFAVNGESIELDESQYPIEQIDVSYSFSVRKIDLAAKAGLRYYPIPRLGIDLSYEYGLLNMTKNTTSNRNSGLQLALVYQLHR